MNFLDFQDPRPIYEQIADMYKKLILQGVLKTDEPLPSVRKLAMELSTNPNTVQKAYTALEAEEIGISRSELLDGKDGKK